MSAAARPEAGPVAEKATGLGAARIDGAPPVAPPAATPAAFPTVFAEIASRATLDPAVVRAGVDAVLAGAWNSSQVAAFAAAVRLRGETADVLVAAASALRGAMAVVEHDLAPVVDTCGTGGDGSNTLNLSTAAAVVVAATGHYVAKHGNRSASSLASSADVVAAMGVPIDVPTSRQAEVLREAKIAFLFAQAHHPALRHASQARKDLGMRTLFNALGPLANPARASHQLVGVYEDALRPLMAEALGALGAKRAWVVRSEDGLDEVSPSAPTRITEIEGGALRERRVTPEDFGLPRLERAAIAGADSASNAKVLIGILEGEPHPAKDAVILNAAATLAVLGEELRAGAERARRALERGAAREVLEAWREAARKRVP